MSRQEILKIEDVHRSFGKVKANNGVSLSVEPGQVVGLLGHNGAGKTTLVSQIVGLLKPDSGRITVGDIDAVAQPALARSMVALQSQSQAPVEGLTPRGAITLAAQLRGENAGFARQRVDELAAELEITPWLDRRALPEGGGLSGGIRRLTSFAMAVAAPTPLLILDEPTNDVDAYRRRLLWNAVRRRADEGAGVLLVTHNVSEIEGIVDTLVILEQGNVIARGTTDNLRDSNLLRLTLTGDLTQAGYSDPIKPLFDINLVAETAGRSIFNLREEYADAALDWAMRLKSKGLIDSFALHPMNLEDVYLDLTEQQKAAEHV